MNRIPLLARAFETYTNAEEWLNYMKSLLIKLDKKESNSVADVAVTFRPGGSCTLRIRREPKYVTRDEVTLLASEYSRTELEILQLLTKPSRKIEVHYAHTDTRIDSDRRLLADAKPQRKAKANAGAPGARKRKTKGIDKLLQPGHDSHMLTQSPVLTGDGTQT